MPTFIHFRQATLAKTLVFAVYAALSVVCYLSFSPGALAQSTSASVSGRVTDQSNLVMPEVDVEITNADTGVTHTTKTNSEGFYSFLTLSPGNYVMSVHRLQFRSVSVTGITLHVQDTLSRNFVLQVGSSDVSITVTADQNNMNTTGGAVSTVVDRQFVANIPLNGRSFQSLIQLTPGVVVTPTSNSDSGQFSVNGQRASANYFMVDGVSANIGAASNNIATQNAAGAIPGFSVLGGTNNLVSVDALQEFRIQTSTYAPEFGRTPGAQVSIETRSGNNQFHGSVFEYLRNDVFDAGNWFNGTVSPPLKKSQERQNDFGGVFGGPIFKNKTFFFFSYEGEILRLPRTVIAKVPSLAVRQDPNTPAAILPLLTAYPLPNQPASGADVANRLAPFVASFSDRSTLNATSLRIDHRINERLAVFGRYNYSPSELITRGNGGVQALNDVTQFAVNTQTLTLGSVWSVTPTLINDLRFNYSRNRASGADSLDSFGGAVVPPASFSVPTAFSGKSADGIFNFFSFPGTLRIGPLTTNVQRQVNFVEGVSLQRGSHAMKFGVDYRRLSPTQALPAYTVQTSFLGVPSAVSLTPLGVFVTANTPVEVRFQNFGAYAQDTWKLMPRITMTYGIRWDIDFAPSTVDGPDFLALANVSNPNTVTVAPPGTPIFGTKYHNVAPRIGVAYLLSPAPKHQTLLRGGFGVFYDLATQQVANLISSSQFPFGGAKICNAIPNPACGGGSPTFPLPASVLQPPPIAFSPTQTLVGFDPDLNLPYTLQWNVALEQSLGDQQTISGSYIGAIGRGLIQQEFAFRPGRANVILIGNHATSDYHALQLQFRRQASRNLQALVSYTWSHSIDTASSSSSGVPENFFPRAVGGDSSRGSSDFDVRHAFSAGVTYSVPSPNASPVLKSIASGWSLDSMIQGRSATPVDVEDARFAFLGNSIAAVRPDVVAGQPLYLQGAGCAVLSGGLCPGGKAFNPKAFTDPPIDPITHLPRQGNLGRNTLRGFGALQWDFAVRRTFALRESLHLAFRAEFFNVLNHPNFANPSGSFLVSPSGILLNSSFGVATTMLNQGLGGGANGGGGFNPLYQIGGPRSGQLALKLLF